MILNAFFSGLAIGLSLIIAIGSQNAFVLRQGLSGKYVWLSILFCTGSDCILIFAGTFGIGAMLFPYFESLSSIIYLLTALWVGFYGFLRLRTAINYNNSMKIIHGEKQDFLGVISSLFLMFSQKIKPVGPQEDCPKPTHFFSFKNLKIFEIF